jgi:hypothetical protein
MDAAKVGIFSAGRLFNEIQLRLSANSSPTKNKISMNQK